MRGTMMKCGHVALGVDKANKPVCPICIGIRPEAEEIETNLPNLTGRMAKCPYCPSRRPSQLDLPFFEHLPHEPCDSFYCGCRGWD